ncbi:putative endonuclease-reverse transcriptase [Trichonephila clavipes]|nr:putative endonuclease-reverse transcriptase [Trichonephila clavipes]
MCSDGEDLEHNTTNMYEVEVAMKKLSNNMSAGPDNIKAEVFKISEKGLNKTIHYLICSIWTQEQMPIEWEGGSVCPICQKGDKLECGNYGGISKFNTAYKILSIFLFDRLGTYTVKTKCRVSEFKVSKNNSLYFKTSHQNVTNCSFGD